jgi:hypothetical protein
MSESIFVRIKPNGTSIIDVKGVKGEGCKALTASLEAALGTPSTSVPTGEAYELVQEQTQNQSQNVEQS